VIDGIQYEVILFCPHPIHHIIGWRGLGGLYMDEVKELDSLLHPPIISIEDSEDEVEFPIPISISE
jgi:hypothetical protein